MQRDPNKLSAWFDTLKKILRKPEKVSLQL